MEQKISLFLNWEVEIQIDTEKILMYFFDLLLTFASHFWLDYFVKMIVKKSKVTHQFVNIYLAI